MNKFIIAMIVMLALYAGNALYAQDVITLKSGEELNAKVEEVNSTEVKYRKFWNLQGPIYTIEKSKIFMIKYEDGSKDLFNDETPVQPLMNRQNNKYEYQQQYRSQDLNFNYSPKNPTLAWLFSFLVPGVGQFYNGDIGKGIGFLATDLVGYSLMLGGASSDNDGEKDGLVLTGAALVLGSWIWAQIDAPKSAKKKNQANGYLTWDLGKNGANISLQPFKLVQTPVNQRKSLVSACGMGLAINF